MIYAIGDIHGQLTMLRDLLEQIRPRFTPGEDRLLFLGDYIDRGEDSKGVIDLLLELRAEIPDTIFLRGNHEQLILDALEGPPPAETDQVGYVMFSDITINWIQNGGQETLMSYEVRDWLKWWESIPAEHWEFIKATETEVITETYHFVHAGLLPEGETWEGADWGLDPRLWIREPFLASEVMFGGRIVVFGHTPQTTGRPLIMFNKIGLDTGAVFGGPLTAAIFNPNAVGPPRLNPELLTAAYQRYAPTRKLDGYEL